MMTWEDPMMTLGRSMMKPLRHFRQDCLGSKSIHPASIHYKSTAGRYRPVSYSDGPITARYRFIQTAYWAFFFCNYGSSGQPWNRLMNRGTAFPARLQVRLAKTEING